MGADERIRDAEKALGKGADDYDLDYEEEPEDSDTGKPQLTLYGEIIEQETIDKLKNVGFQFLYAQTALGDEDEDEEDDKEDEEEDEEENEVEAGADEPSKDDDEEEFSEDLEIVFEDTKAKAHR